MRKTTGSDYINCKFEVSVYEHIFTALIIFILYMIVLANGLKVTIIG